MSKRKPIVLEPGGGRTSAMGGIDAVFKADGDETAERYSLSEWWLEPKTKGPGAHLHDEDDVFYVLADVVAVVIQYHLAIVALDRENLPEDRLEADVFALGRRGVELKKLSVGVCLQLNEIRRRNDLFDFTEVDSFVGSRWHCLFQVGWLPARPLIIRNDTRQVPRVRGKLAEISI
jgi:hypothetical protein